MADEIFRFLFLRPPDPGTAVTVQPSKGFAKDLAAAISSAFALRRSDLRGGIRRSGNSSVSDLIALV
jgi:hypothetical protein